MSEKENTQWITVNGAHIPIYDGQSREAAVISFMKDNEIPSKKKDRIKLPDEKLPRSCGARWINYNIQMPDGTTAHFQEGSKLHHKEVFAGKGCKRKIDQVDKLVDHYGGKAEDWQKIKAFGTIVTEDGEIEEAEIHWYEEPTIGKIGLKVKERK